MLRRRLLPSTAAFARTLYFGPDPIGKVHPDVAYGYQQANYRGKGWIGAVKQMPIEQLICMGGSTLGSTHDRQGHVQDPEDPRHPLIRMQMGDQKGFDSSVHTLVHGSWGPIPKGSRLLQLCYNNYLEPFSCNRVAGHLNFWSKVPCNHHETINWTAAYCGQTTSLVGAVIVGYNAVIMEGCVFRADCNQIYIFEAVQILENCYFIADAPTTLHHYQRGEAFNPYQTLEAMEGTIRVCMNTIVEANCVVEACMLGTFNRIGHGTHIMKGTQTGVLCHVLPGSVVLANTNMKDGELWGGAPARKLGTVSKFEWKKPWLASAFHREMVYESYAELSRYGDEKTYFMEEMGKLETLMVRFEKDLPEGIKAQIRFFIEGREPYQHSIARITQGWVPANRPDDKMNDAFVPAIFLNVHRNHNDDSTSDYAGSLFNWRSYPTGERRW